MNRLITRHQNRKLYDPSAKRYVSLADLVGLVVQGDSVRVVEHPGGEDATTRILAQALVDLVKRKAESLPAGLMESLLRLAGGSRLTETEHPSAVRELATRTRHEAEAIATRLVSRGRLGIEEALHLRKEVEDAIHRGVAAAGAATRKPIAAFRPGHAVRTIGGLARELKALETIVAQPAAHQRPELLKKAPLSRKHRAQNPSTVKPRS